MLGDAEEQSRYSCLLNPEQCYARYDLPDIEPWPSMDLREARLIGEVRDQGDCQSSWAISTAEVLENLILRDLGYLRQEINYYGQFNSGTLQLSHQYIMSNDFVNKYCTDGNAVSAIQQLYVNSQNGLELERNLDSSNPEL